MRSFAATVAYYDAILSDMNPTGDTRESVKRSNNDTTSNSL
jgi:hypothetical protein